MMKKDVFVKYEAPELEVLEVVVEKGFAATEGDGKVEVPEDIPFS